MSETCALCKKSVIYSGLYDEEKKIYWHRACYLKSITKRKEKIHAGNVDGKEYVKRIERMIKLRELTY